MNSYFTPGFLPSLPGDGQTSGGGLTCNFPGFSAGRYGSSTDYASSGGSTNGGGGPVTTNNTTHSSYLGGHQSLTSSGGTHSGTGQYASGASNGSLLGDAVALHHAASRGHLSELNGYGDLPSSHGHGHGSAAASSPWGVHHAAAGAGSAGGTTASQQTQPQQSPTDFSGHSSPAMCGVGDGVPLGNCTSPYSSSQSIPFYPWMGVVGKFTYCIYHLAPNN